MSQDTIAITDDEGNAIIIRSKLNFGQMNRVKSASLKVRLKPDAPSENDIEMDWPVWQEKLLTESVTGWHGPRFAGTIFSKDALLALDDDDPLLQKVLTEISARNNKKDGADPKALRQSGATESKIIDQTPSP